MMNEGITFGGWLKQRRKELGITREQLAEHLSLSDAMLGKIESGDRRPSGQVAAMLADYFRIPADEHKAFVVFARTGRATPEHSTIVGAVVPRDIALRAPWRTTYAYQTNLPAVLTPLVGRETAVAALCDQFLQKTRLLTLTGSPGIGKTRLALQVAWELVEHFDEVYFVELAPISDPDLVLSTIAHALGVRELGGQEIGELLRQHVQGKRMLLVLDNFEQVLDAAPSVVWLMEASPWLKVLATSREALHVRGERRFPVPPLELPDLMKTWDLQALAVVPSIELFLERAQAAEPGFALTQENARDVVSICTRLEGLPLAIELAGARAGLFSPEAMLARLERRLNLLTEGPRDLPQRQRALRNTIEWSYDLLNAREQELFRTLAVFVGGCTAQAVEALLNSGSNYSIEVDTLVGLQSLKDKSLLSVSEGSRQKDVTRGESRYTMLEMISEYAFERLLESGQLQAVQERHARYFLRLVEETEPDLRGPRQIVLLDMLEAEHDNIRAAFRWALESKNTELGLRLMGALYWFWNLHSHYVEGLRWARAVLAMSDPAERSAIRAKALWAAGGLAWNQADPEARAFIEESVSIWREVGDKRGLGRALIVLGMAAQQQGQRELAYAAQLESVSVLREAGDKSGLTLALGALTLAMLALEGSTANDYRIDYKELRALLDESTRLAREAGDNWSLPLALRNLGWVAMRQGNYAEARVFVQESLDLQQEMGTTHEAAATLGTLAQLAQLDGALQEALELYEESLQMYRACNDMSGVVITLADIGTVALLTVNIQRAIDALTEAAKLIKEAPTRRGSTLMLEPIGCLMASLGDPIRAAVLLSAARSLPVATSPTRIASARTEFTKYLESARAKLDESAWNQAWARGEAMSIEEALQFASDALATLSSHSTT